MRKCKEKINNHLTKFKNKILFDLPINNDLNGFYVGPKIIELDKLGDVKNEVLVPFYMSININLMNLKN